MVLAPFVAGQVFTMFGCLHSTQSLKLFKIRRISMQLHEGFVRSFWMAAGLTCLVPTLLTKPRLVGRLDDILSITSNSQPIALQMGPIGPIETDVIVVGAGFGGCYLLHLLRKNGFKIKVLEAGTTLGGVWCWNVCHSVHC